MSTDYRRKAKQYRHTSNAFLTLAGLVTAVAVGFILTGALWPGLAVFTAAAVLILAGLSIRLEAREFARLARSQSRMNAWNRRSQ